MLEDTEDRTQINYVAVHTTNYTMPAPLMIVS